MHAYNDACFWIFKCIWQIYFNDSSCVHVTFLDLNYLLSEKLDLLMIFDNKLNPLIFNELCCSRKCTVFFLNRQAREERLRPQRKWTSSTLNPSLIYNKRRNSVKQQAWAGRQILPTGACKLEFSLKIYFR